MNATSPLSSLRQKFILTSILLSVACGISGALAARTPRHTYMQVQPCCWRLLLLLLPPPGWHPVRGPRSPGGTAIRNRSCFLNFPHLLFSAHAQITFCLVAASCALSLYSESPVTR